MIKNSQISLIREIAVMFPQTMSWIRLCLKNTLSRFVKTSYVSLLYICPTIFKQNPKSFHSDID